MKLIEPRSALGHQRRSVGSRPAHPFPSHVTSYRLRPTALIPPGRFSFRRWDEPSINKELKLTDWNQPTKLAWPAPQTPFALLALQSMPALAPYPGGDWWRGREVRAHAHRAESERAAAFYEEQTRQREEREDAQ